MKIIKLGTKPWVGNTVHNKTCFNCGTEFEFQQKEAQIFYDDDDGGKDYMIIHCPECTNDIYINL